MHEKPFVLPIKTPLGYYFYEISRNEIVRVDKELFEYISDILKEDGSVKNTWSKKSETAYCNLFESGYLQPNALKEVRHPATDYIECYLTRGLQQVTLQVTQCCNLRCKYCIYSEFSNKRQRSHSNTSMSFDTAKKAIDFYRIHSVDVDDKIIAFYGGEPLLAFPLIKDVVEYAEEVFWGKRIKFTITTNATLLTDEIIEFLLEHKFAIFFSLDGPEQAQNMNRVFQDGRGTYDVVISKIKSVYDKDPECLTHHSISMVVTPQHDYDELLRLFEIPELKKINLLYSYVEKDARTIYPSEEFTKRYQYDRFIAFVKKANEDSSELNKIIEGDARKLDTELQKMVSHEPHEIAAPGDAGIITVPSGFSSPQFWDQFTESYHTKFGCPIIGVQVSNQICDSVAGLPATLIHIALDGVIKQNHLINQRFQVPFFNIYEDDSKKSLLDKIISEYIQMPYGVIN